METILYTISEQIKNISILLHPIIPDATYKILDIMNISDDEISLNSINKLGLINHEKDLKKLEILFKKIEHDN
jgi:methionyl-tRNA synthetase